MAGWKRRTERQRSWMAGLGMALLLLAGTAALKAQGSGREQDQEGAYAMGPQGRMVRGTVTAATGDHLTLKTEAGDTYQVVVTTNTRIMKDRQTAKIADIHTGDGMGAMGVIDAPAKTVHAAMLMVVDAEQIKKARENMGKTYITGKVLAIDDVNLTIQRQDGVTQKIMVDEGPSFKKGGRRMAMAMRGDPRTMGTGSGPGASGGQGASGARAGGGDAADESITLADVKVGDMVAGQGALKSGVFVPTELMVMDPAARRRRQQDAGGTGSSTDSATTTPGAATAPPAASPK